MNAKRLIILILFLSGMLSSCAAAASTMAPAPTMAPASPKLAYSNTTGGTDALTTSPGEPAPVQMVIKNASLIIVVDVPGQAMTSISEMASKMGGFVVSSNTYQTYSSENDRYPEAQIKIRVPAEKLDEALAQVRALVKNPAEDIRKENVTGQDVTKDYTDAQSRLTNLEAAEKQLLKIQESATKTEDVLTVFRELTNIRQQIEVIKGQLKYYADSTATSAIDVQILAQAGIAPISIGGWQPLGVAADALNLLLSLSKLLINLLIYVVIVFLPLGLVLYFPIRWLRRLLRRSAPPPKPAAVPPVKPE